LKGGWLSSFLASRFYAHFMNTECTRIAEQMATVISGEAWYGDSVQKILSGINAKQAQAHPIPKVHSIWELVHHMEAWVKFAIGATQGTPIPAWPAMPKEQDYPPVTDTSDQAWDSAVKSFFISHTKLVETIRSFGDSHLQDTVPGRAYNFNRLLPGMTQHAIYHSAQISILKNAQK
jgi:hypothetical protein